MESDKKKDEKPKHPRSNANPFSALTFSWTLPLFWKGYKQSLEVEDLYEPLDEHRSNYLGDKFEKVWNEEVKKCAGKKKDPSLLNVIISVFGWEIMAYGILLFFDEIFLRVAQPLFLGGLIDHFTPESKVTKNEAYLYATGIIMCSALTVLTMHPYMMGIMHIGMKVRIAACSLIYRKALRLSKTALGQTTVGQVVNLLSNDVNRFDIAFIFIHNLWVGPLQTCIVTYFLWQLIGGPSSIIGLFSLLIFIPLQAWLGKKASSLRLRTAVRTDERVRLMNEIISGIQVIKMYTWEKPFAKLVSHARRKEINEIRKSSFIRGIMLSFIIFHTRTSFFCSILAYVLFGNHITAQKVFVVTSFYNTLRQTMTVFFPQGITQIAEANISIKRIQKFLLYKESTIPLLLNSDNSTEKQKDDIKTENLLSDYGNDMEKSSVNLKSTGISIKDGTAKWTDDQNENTLTNLNIEFISGRLTAIIGPVGSGKTSLLHAILKELPLSRGSINVGGVVSYASQEPWLFGGSVRQNILFGEPYNKDRYRHVVKVCALRTDFEQFEFGDKTIVGERGVSLSGGQRARINLARAVYKDADIYLLDDPLSAVDTHVGKHLFEDCITGYLKNKTVILITHQLQYLSNVDHIVLLENGIVNAEGTYAELQQTGQDFTKLLAHYEEEEELVRRLSYSRQSSMQSVASSLDESHLQEEPVEVAETRSKGTVSAAVYKGYLFAGGGCFMMVLMLFMCVFAQFLASTGDYWITYWVNLEEHVYLNTTLSEKYASSSNLYIAPRDICVYVFCAITAGTIVITLVRSFMFFIMCMNASTKLHDSMFTSITRATMRFFNTNSSGRILNRFSKDMGSIDELLPAALIDCLQIGLTLVAIISVVAMINPWLLLPTGVAGIIFYYLRIFYLSTSRSVKRLEGVTRSPVFAHLNASLQGLTTIRAFRAENILMEEFDNHQDLHSSAWYLFIASSRAFGYWLDLVCLVYIGLVTLSFLLLDESNFGGNVGLAITQSIGLTGMFQWGMRQSAELENQMTSVERVLEYTNLESEPPLESPPDKKPRESWPEVGKVVFCQVFLRYTPTESWVLKNLNFTIFPRQKIGIVGRTGAGKSSLISALFRLTEVQGSIVIDDIPISSIGLHELRSKISIIPQEPVLFSGSLRKNLDPFDQYSDDILWNALEEVELKDVVAELVGGLNAKISEGGSNMSVGQRQLVCLARAIIRNNKILVLDEATANVDPQTDSLIQDTIRRKFASCTVFTIAHRLNTVMDSDKVLVMDSGTLVEFDHPYNLLKNDDGFLYKMVQQTGKATAEMLTEVAMQSYTKLTGQPLQNFDGD